LGKYIYLSNGRNYSAFVEDGVIFDGLNEEESYFNTDGIRNKGQCPYPISEEHGTYFDGANNLIIEVHVVALELTFYGNTKHTCISLSLSLSI